MKTPLINSCCISSVRNVKGSSLDRGFFVFFFLHICCFCNIKTANSNNFKHIYFLNHFEVDLCHIISTNETFKEKLINSVEKNCCKQCKKIIILSK